MIAELRENIVDRIGKYVPLRKVAAHEWAAGCPVCGGKDRFRVNDGKGWFCRRCTGEPGGAAHWNDFGDFTAFAFGWSLAETLKSIGADRKLSPTEIATLDAARTAAQAEQHQAEAVKQAEVHNRLTSRPEWRNYAENVINNPTGRALWNQKGLTDPWIEYYGIGYCPQRTWHIDGDPDKCFDSDSLTIPYFRPVYKPDQEFDHWHVIGLQHRLLMTNAPGGKYRPHFSGAGKHLFYPDIYQTAVMPSYDLLIVEGEIKSMITWSSLWPDGDCIATNLQIVGVPGHGWREEWLTEFRKPERVFVCLDSDRDAQDAALRLVKTLGSGARNVMLPDKIDDLITMGVLDGWKLMEVLEK